MECKPTLTSSTLNNAKRTSPAKSSFKIEKEQQSILVHIVPNQDVKAKEFSNPEPFQNPEILLDEEEEDVQILEENIKTQSEKEEQADSQDIIQSPLNIPKDSHESEEDIQILENQFKDA